MRQALLFIGLGLLAGIVLAGWIGRSPLPVPGTDIARSDFDATPTATTDRAIAARVTELERQLTEETERRRELESTVAALSERLGPDGVAPLAADTQGVVDLGTIDQPDRGRFFAERRARREQQASPDFRRDQLVAAGFAVDQAQALIDRESRMRLEIMNESYEARRQGEPFDPRDVQQEMQSELRAELGDDAYTRYLEATGRPASVAVTEVLDNSAGQLAGLQAGDEIVGYNGERVFSLFDLRALTIAGEPGENVAVDIVRDGQPMQLYIQRGPLGITGGGFARRGPRGTVFGVASGIPVP